jgi:hypothetical protein
MDAKRLNQLEQDAAKELGATTQHGFHAATVLALIQHIRECQVALTNTERIERENAELRKQLSAIPITQFPQSFRDDLAEAIRLGKVTIS